MPCFQILGIVKIVQDPLNQGSPCTNIFLKKAYVDHTALPMEKGEVVNYSEVWELLCNIISCHVANFSIAWDWAKLGLVQLVLNILCTRIVHTYVWLSFQSHFKTFRH